MLGMPQGNDPLQLTKEKRMKIHLLLSLGRLRLRLVVRIRL
jgi:hypothetical protein